MMTRVNWRGRGVARALMLEAERIARERGRNLLTLATGPDDGAGRCTRSSASSERARFQTTR